jgi:hypothetical protein
MGMMVPMMFFISKTEAFRVGQSIKRAARFVNEILSGRDAIPARGNMYDSQGGITFPRFSSVGHWAGRYSDYRSFAE